MHLQTEIGIWAARTFGAQPEREWHDMIRAVLAHLREEVDEIEDRILAAGDHDFASLRDEGFGEELADAHILLLQLASISGHDLERATRAKHIVNQNREWGPPDEEGVVRHIPDEATADRGQE